MSPRRARAVIDRVGEDPAAALRDHLVAATGTLLDELPLGAITTRDIARRAGVSDGVLYNHFGDKAELVLAALVRRYAELLARFGAVELRAGTRTVEANLARFARALLELESDALLIGAGLLADPPLLRRFWDAIHTPPFGPDLLRAPLVAYLAAERDRGRIAADADVESTVTLLFGAVAVFALTGRLHGRHSVADRVASREVARITRALIRGLAPA